MEFREPPISDMEQRTTKWRNIVAELRGNPGEWAFVGNYSPGVPAQIRAGMYPAFINDDDIRSADVQLANDWEVTSRGSDDERRRCDVYIRYIGE